MAQHWTKGKGNLAELKGAADLIERGFKVAFPFGEDWDYDLVVDRDGDLERVQVKFTESAGDVVFVRCRSNSLTKGKVMRIKRYTAEMVDWIAVYDATTKCCYYVPARELAQGRDLLSLRLTAAKNNQRRGIRYAEDYRGFPPPVLKLQNELVEPVGLEPTPSDLQSRRSSN